MGTSAKQNVYREVGNSETYWRTQRDRWRTVSFVSIFIWLMTVVAVKCG